MKRTALAWKNLVNDWRRLSLGIAGVAFAAILMFMQNGFRNALLDSPVQLIEMLNCDLVAISVARYSLPTDQSFPESLYDRATSEADIVAATPLFLERVRAQVRVAGEPRRPIRAIGIEPTAGWFLDPRIELQLASLQAPETALLDQRTRSTYGFHLDSTGQLSQQEIELADHKIRLVGLINIGTDFANDGTLLMSRKSFLHYFPSRQSGKPASGVDLALFQLRTGADKEAVAARLTTLDPQVWKVFTKQALINREVQFWNKQTPIGMIFFIEYDRNLSWQIF